jgi:amino acid transporter
VSVLGATALYALIQLVYVAVSRDPAGATTPLDDAARDLGGVGAGRAMAFAALVSAFGFSSSSTLVGPRYLAAFAEDGFLPSLFGRRSRRGTPLYALLALAILVAALAAVVDFDQLADTANLACVAQYTATSASLLAVWWRSRADRTGWRRLGPTVPLLGLAASATLASQVARGEALLGAALTGVGLLLGIVTRLARSR